MEWLLLGVVIVFAAWVLDARRALIPILIVWLCAAILIQIANEMSLPVPEPEREPVPKSEPAPEPDDPLAGIRILDDGRVELS